MPFANFKKGKIHYNARGKGRAVILLHGFLQDVSMWDDYAEKLAGDNRRVICMDLPGHGKSDCFGYVHEPALIAEAVKKVMVQERIRKAVLVGHSLGGYAAIAFGELYPDNLRGICMFFSSVAADTPDKKAARHIVARLIKQDHKSFIRKSFPMLFTPRARKLFKTEIKAMKKKALKMTARAVLAANEGMRVRPDREIVLRFAPYPVHFVIGALDPIIDTDTVLRQARLGEHITYDLLERSGHMGHIENRAQCLRSIKRFLTRAESGRKHKH